LKKQIRLLLNSKFARNVVIVASGSAGAQAISLVFSPVITRLYGPEAFGLLGTFLALVTILSPVAAFCYPIAIVLPNKDNEARGVVKLSIYISVLVATFLMSSFLAGGDTLIKLIGAGAVGSFVLLIPLIVLFNGWIQIANQWLIRKKQFHVTAKGAVAQAFVLNTIKVGVGWFYPFAAVLIILTTVGSALHLVILYLAGIKKKCNNLYQQHKAHPPLLELAKRYYDFPVYRAPQALINAISRSLPVLILAAIFGPASAGYYAIGKRVLAMPSSLIGGSVRAVFYPRIVEAAHKNENLSKLIIKATLGLAAVGFFPFAAVVFFGPWLFGFVFGDEWVIAGNYARWLALWSFLGLINSPCVATIPVLNLQMHFLIYEIFSIGLRVIALFAGFYLFSNDVSSIILYSLAGVILNMLLILYTIFQSRCPNCKEKNIFYE